MDVIRVDALTLHDADYSSTCVESVVEVIHKLESSLYEAVTYDSEDMSGPGVTAWTMSQAAGI